MKLFIDDIRNAPDESWMVARTITSAINALIQFDFDEISLDHDISHQIVMGEMSRPYPCPEDFSCLCHVIGIKHREKYDAVERISTFPKITIHSGNAVGAEKMKKILADYGIESTYVRQNPANRLELIV